MMRGELLGAAAILAIGLIGYGYLTVPQDPSETGQASKVAPQETEEVPRAQPNGTPLTDAYCQTDEALDIFMNHKTCAQIACEEGDEEACETARVYATAQAPTEEDEVDYAYTAAHERTSTEDLLREVDNPDCEGIDEETCSARIANRQMELLERGVCQKDGHWTTCEKPTE